MTLAFLLRCTECVLNPLEAQDKRESTTSCSFRRGGNAGESISGLLTQSERLLPRLCDRFYFFFPAIRPCYMETLNLGPNNRSEETQFRLISPLRVNAGAGP